jgi:hypothetical protein
MQILLLKVNTNIGKMLNETTNPTEGAGVGGRVVLGKFFDSHANEYANKNE